jgi:hypothetical protein
MNDNLCLSAMILSLIWGGQLRYENDEVTDGIDENRDEGRYSDLAETRTISME